MPSTVDYTYLTQQGVIVADTSIIKEQVESEYIALFGSDLDLDPSTPQGMLIAAEVIARSNMVRANAALANQINPNLAGGGFLDAIWALTGGERTQASPTLVTGVLLTGVPYAIINSGKRAKTAAGDLFKVVTTVQLDGSGNGTAVFQSVENGPVPCGTNDLTTIVDNVLGWETVTNPTAGVLGKATQTDAQVRTLRKQTLAKQGTSISEAIMSAVRLVSGVTSLQFRENVTNGTLVIDGVSLVAHSVWLCVDGGVDEDIGLALLESKSAGANWNGAESVAVTDPSSGQSYTVNFARPTPVDIYFRITVREVTPVANQTTSVVDAVLAWAANEVNGIEGLLVGNSVSPFEVAAAISDQVEGLFITKVEVSNDGIAWQTTQYDIAIDEIGATGSDKIEVVVS